MCGICGKLLYSRDGQVEAGILHAMMNTMVHRGPDARGQLFDGPVGLGHVRLSVIDLSNSANQPIANEDKTVWVVLNGEIYNFVELRAGLVAKGHRFSSKSDAEVIVHLYEEVGVDCLSQLRGMFAFAVWDSKTRSLFLARDRVGIKPLYYCDSGRSFLFASELKALLVDSEVRRDLNYQAIDSCLTYYYIPGKETLFNAIHKLEPGHFLFIDQQGKKLDQKYWDLEFVNSNHFASLDETAEALSSLLKETVRLHMISDVPVGLLLSGGVDSTGILKFYRELSNDPIKSFTVGFEGQIFPDERVYARIASQHFRTDHYEMSITAEEFRDFLPKYVWHMEEPICEPPAIALYYVAKLARDHVTVLLSGEGADEAFGGYQNYSDLLMIEKTKALLGPWCSLISSVLKFSSTLMGSSRGANYARQLGSSLSDNYPSRSSSPSARLNPNWRNVYHKDFVSRINTTQPGWYFRGLFDHASAMDPLNQMLYVDTKTWLPDDLLVKADKMTMANSLELRVPMLDHVLLEFAASIAPSFKVQGKATKRVLKRALEGRIPQEIIQREKAGFPVPYRVWLARDLRDFAVSTITSQKALSRQIFAPQELEKKIYSKDSDACSSKEIFSMLVLELWHQAFA